MNVVKFKPREDLELNALLVHKRFYYGNIYHVILYCQNRLIVTDYIEYPSSHWRQNCDSPINIVADYIVCPEWNSELNTFIKPNNSI